MNTYRLSPIQPDYPGWRFSSYKVTVVVRAESETEARRIADMEFSSFAKIIPLQETIGGPW